MAICLDKKSAFTTASTVPWMLYWLLAYQPLFAHPASVLGLTTGLFLNFFIPTLTFIYASFSWELFNKAHQADAAAATGASENREDAADGSSAAAGDWAGGLVSQGSMHLREGHSKPAGAQHHRGAGLAAVSGAVAGAGGARTREMQRQLHQWLEEFARRAPDSDVAQLLQRQTDSDESILDRDGGRKSEAAAAPVATGALLRKGSLACRPRQSRTSLVQSSDGSPSQDDRDAFGSPRGSMPLMRGASSPSLSAYSSSPPETGLASPIALDSAAAPDAEPVTPEAIASLWSRSAWCSSGESSEASAAAEAARTTAACTTSDRADDTRAAASKLTLAPPPAAVVTKKASAAVVGELAYDSTAASATSLGLVDPPDSSERAPSPVVSGGRLDRRKQELQGRQQQSHIEGPVAEAAVFQRSRKRAPAVGRPQRGPGGNWQRPESAAAATVSSPKPLDHAAAEVLADHSEADAPLPPNTQAGLAAPAASVVARHAGEGSGEENEPQIQQLERPARPASEPSEATTSEAATSEATASRGNCEAVESRLTCESVSGIKPKMRDSSAGSESICKQVEPVEESSSMSVRGSSSSSRGDRHSPEAESSDLPPEERDTNGTAPSACIPSDKECPTLTGSANVRTPRAIRGSLQEDRGLASTAPSSASDGVPAAATVVVAAAVDETPATASASAVAETAAAAAADGTCSVAAPASPGGAGGLRRRSRPKAIKPAGIRGPICSTLEEMQSKGAQPADCVQIRDAVRETAAAAEASANLTQAAGEVQATGSPKAEDASTSTPAETTEATAKTAEGTSAEGESSAEATAAAAQAAADTASTSFSRTRKRVLTARRRASAPQCPPTAVASTPGAPKSPSEDSKQTARPVS